MGRQRGERDRKRLTGRGKRAVRVRGKKDKERQRVIMNELIKR